jgi:hypothetical protein
MNGLYRRKELKQCQIERISTKTIHPHLRASGGHCPGLKKQPNG